MITEKDHGRRKIRALRKMNKKNDSVCGVTPKIKIVTVAALILALLLCAGILSGCMGGDASEEGQSKEKARQEQQQSAEKKTAEDKSKAEKSAFCDQMI